MGGCAPSKPSLLNHVNSPQKGFIIFNAKTIEFIKVHEHDLKIKIKEKCEQKLFSNKTLKIKGKKLNINEAAAAAATATSSPTTTESNDNQLLNSTLNNYEKEVATLDMTIDLVLKYVVEDFDIDNFKSNSNHLSLKQIKKDILKKYNTIPSLSQNTSTSTNESKTNTLTLNKQPQVDNSFYKKALTTAIDEFGAVIQEQFILIAEFKGSEEQQAQLKQEKSVENGGCGGEESKKIISNNGIPIIEDSEIEGETTYTLKEALEQSRHNFYNGKKSIVLMTVSGRYILRDAPIVAAETSSGNLETSLNNSNKVNELSSNKNEEEEEELLTPVKPKTVTMFDTPKLAETTTEHEDIEVVVVEKKNQGEQDSEETTTTTTTTVITTTTKTIVTNEENDEPTKVDVKKEIAISILNVGEVLAKTIDRYSLEVEQKEQQKQDEELPKIEINSPESEQQQNDQMNDSSASFSSPSDLISSLSSSSVISSSSPNKQLEEDKIAQGGEDMSFLIREIENQLSVQLDLHADQILKNDTSSIKQQVEEEEEATNGHDLNDVILRQIYEVDKKVQSVVETCSEDDDYEDETEIIHKDNDKLFKPTKSIRIDIENKELCDEIKQISNVIQDLVQTIQVPATTETLKSNESEESAITFNKKSLSTSISSSNIPVRKPSLLKQKSTTIDDIESSNGGNHQNLDTNESFGEITNESFNESLTNSARNSLEPNNTTPDIMNLSKGTKNGKNSKKNFKSKLPKRK
jgi:hypothetical protein